MGARSFAELGDIALVLVVVGTHTSSIMVMMVQNACELGEIALATGQIDNDAEAESGKISKLAWGR